MKKTIFLLISIFFIFICFLSWKASIAAPVNLPTAIMTTNCEKKKQSGYESCFPKKEARLEQPVKIFGGADVLFSFLNERQTKSKEDKLGKEIEGQFYTIKMCELTF